jgi:hypothetical protein
MKTTLESIFRSVGIDLGVNRARLDRILMSGPASLGEDKIQKLARLSDLLEVVNDSILEITSDLSDVEKKHLM